MVDVVVISLENEMDIVLAHKRTIKVAEKLGLTIATQTAFATAVSEISRTVIEYTNTGNLFIGFEQRAGRYYLQAKVVFEGEIAFTAADTGFYYAQKLVPEFKMTNDESATFIEMKIGLPKVANLNKVTIGEIKEFFDKEPPINAYEEIKRRNLSLYRITTEQEEELRQSKIIDEKKNEFIAIASHEIKTPMTILRAYTQLAKGSKEVLSDKLRDVLNKIDIQSAKLSTLVQQLLDVSKVENGSLDYSKQRIPFNEFIENQVSLMRHIVPHHEIVIELSDNAEVEVDLLRMEQVFSNLIGNSAKYSVKQTQITISTLVEDNFITVAIKDQGMGMSKDTIKSVFNKFYRANNVIKTHSGLGMGLFITSKIISDHGGKIWVESEEGKGAIFYFKLPICVLVA